jgi:hypothetical protein
MVDLSAYALVNATVYVNAESEEDAREKALERAENGQCDWEICPGWEKGFETETVTEYGDADDTEEDGDEK